MLRPRIIPCLQLIGDSLVKTVKFRNSKYIGDPINTVRIFNELEVDELCFLDIRASLEGRNPNFEILKAISNECFMPLAYGGGIKDLDTAKKIYSIGFEKIIINTAAVENPNLVSDIASFSGSQSVVGSIDLKRDFFGRSSVYSMDGTKKIAIAPIEYAKRLEQLGAGEILLTSIDREGTWSGFDLELIKSITSQVGVPVIANGGAGTVLHIEQAIKEGRASAVGIGSMVVYQRKGMGVLINFPDKKEIERILGC